MKDYREYGKLEPQDFVRIHEADLKRLESIESALRATQALLEDGLGPLTPPYTLRFLLNQDALKEVSP